MPLTPCTLDFFELSKPQLPLAFGRQCADPYGNKPISIADNKSTIEVGPMDKLPKVIDMVAQHDVVAMPRE